MMNTILWIAQGLLAAIFLFAGSMKLTTPHEKLLQRKGMGWTADFTSLQLKSIGLLEALGAAGVVLPYWAGIMPLLTPLAALGLVITMLVAIWVHMRRGESIVPNLLFLALAVFVAYGRF